MKFMLATLLLAWHPTTAGAAGCAPSGVCVGDESYAYYRDEVHAITVKYIGDDGNIGFTAQGENQPREVAAKRVAVAKPDSCMAGAPKVCVGFTTERKDKDGNVVSGVVVGYFTTGYVAVKEGARVTSYSKDELDKFHDPKEQIAKAIKVIPAAVADPAKPAPGCDCDLKPGAESESLRQFAASVEGGRSAQLEDYLQFWSKADAHPDGPNPWRKCLDQEQFNHPARHDDSWTLAPGCQPDTLYSWGPMQKIKDLAAKIGDGPWQSRPYFDDALFLAESPASSFGYGSNDGSGGYAVRVKLKPGVKFAILRSPPRCDSIPEAEAANTVYIHVFMNDHGDGKRSSGQDFVLCSSGPVHSWSYGTKQFYDELVNDVSRIQNPAHKNDYLSYMTRPDASGAFQPAIFNLGSDSHPFTEEQLANTLKNQLLLSADNAGKVYLNPSVRDDAKAGAEAFTTSIPNWFNEKVDP